jgi:ferredoxin
MSGDPKSPMHLAIDWTRCDGHGLCAALMPQRFERDEWGFPIVRNPSVSPAEEDDMRHVISACPALALRLE